MDGDTGYLSSLESSGWCVNSDLVIPDASTWLVLRWQAYFQAARIIKCCRKGGKG